MKAIFAFCLSIAPLFSAVSAQDPDIEADERSVLEDIYRTSDGDGEIPTAFRDRNSRQQKRVSAPEGAVRVGCVCMNGAQRPTRSTGACSGAGGVRFWLYRKPSGDTVQVFTARHERHPQPLDSVELSETNRPKAKSARSVAAPVQPIIQPIIYTPVAANQLQGGAEGGWFDWSDAATVTGGGISLYVVLRFLLGWIHNHQPLIRYALRHLLRFGKRPPPRKNRKNPPKARL